MSRVCELTGKKAMVGNNVSHAMNKTKRKFNVNLVILHLMLRRGLLNPDDPDYQAIVEGLWLGD